MAQLKPLGMKISIYSLCLNTLNTLLKKREVREGEGGLGETQLKES